MIDTQIKIKFFARSYFIVKAKQIMNMYIHADEKKKRQHTTRLVKGVYEIFFN